MAKLAKMGRNSSFVGWLGLRSFVGVGTWSLLSLNMVGHDPKERFKSNGPMFKGSEGESRYLFVRMVLKGNQLQEPVPDFGETPDSVDPAKSRNRTTEFRSVE